MKLCLLGTPRLPKKIWSLWANPLYGARGTQLPQNGPPDDIVGNIQASFPPLVVHPSQNAEARGHPRAEAFWRNRLHSNHIGVFPTYR